ncbi:MAG: N-6 DNA methylase [Treponema sp.]|nr:N-6 DNA methylase [Treponema sp.]
MSADSQVIKEKAEAQTFETEFLKIFGVNRKKIALFEHEVRFGDGERGYIDLFWKGQIIIEMKTPGKDLVKAYEQAKAYALTLPQKDIPKGILTCDFLNFQYYDLEKSPPEGGGAQCHSFGLDELPAHVELFGHLAGYKDIDPFKRWDPVNIEAAVEMGKLHNRLKDIGYSGHQLELYLVRLMFCLFADDTGIFEPPNMFNKYIIERTSEDGSDLALHIQKIFETLNTEKNDRLKTLDIQLNRFPYVNGQLFEEQLKTADFDRPMRDTILECCALDWSKISPAIFGAMFQSVMNDDERHDIGAHYTSEENILKVIRPLFLDSLREEFNSIKKLSPSSRRERLIKFHEKLASLKFLDPACGCGNFLVISYRELRFLELEILEILLGKEQVLDVGSEIKINVNQFYGIEIEEFPAQIAQVALWLIDHQMNMLVRERFGTYYARIPLTTAASIHHANAMTIDWENVVPKIELSYILGNPPFLGARVMNKRQKAEVETTFIGVKNSGNLDYVCCWYKKAAQYIQSTEIEVAFVSTNSICQGEQVPILWPELMNKHNIKINFAHQTFKWSNEAKGKAAVYCVIIGFAPTDRDEKKIYQYAIVTGEPMETSVKRINAYLVDFDTIFITSRNKPLCNIPPMNFGNMPLDGGHLLLSDEEKKEFIKTEPKSKKYIKPLISAREFLNGMQRWCLWLVDAEPGELRKMPEVLKRVKAVKKFRLASIAPSTRDHASTPSLFRDRNNPNSFILVPRVSSEARKYIPMGLFDNNSIAGDTCMIIPNGTVFHFGVLTSTMHMAWMRYICGRLKSDYRYSKDIVYNNFPWPKPTEKQAAEIEKLAQNVLDTRMKFPNSSLADLYDPVTMPPALSKAHQKLDKAVEAAYGRSFGDDSQRVAYLFELYQELSGELFVEEKKRVRKKK